MADQDLNALPQPGNLGSDEGNVWLTAQYAYHAEVQADRGSQPGAHDQLDRAQAQLAKIVDAGARDTATGYYNAAVDYVNRAGGLDQVALQTATAAADGNVQAAAVLTPDQEAAFKADNEEWADARAAQAAGDSPELALIESTIKHDATTAAATVEKGLAPLTSTLKAFGVGAGVALALIVVLVVVVKVS